MGRGIGFRERRILVGEDTMAHLVALPIRDEPFVDESAPRPWRLIAPVIMVSLRVYRNPEDVRRLPRETCGVYLGKEFQGFLAVDVLSIQTARNVLEYELKSTSMVSVPSV